LKNEIERAMRPKSGLIATQSVSKGSLKLTILASAVAELCTRGLHSLPILSLGLTRVLDAAEAPAAFQELI
jgi:hypothetical protein